MLCVYVFVAPHDSAYQQQQLALQRVMLAANVTYNITIWNSSFVEDKYANLPEKTWHMLFHLPSGCDALLKLDKDAMFCINKLPSIQDIRRSYIGHFSGSSKLALKTKTPKLRDVIRKPALTQLRQGYLPAFRYAYGAAYILGADLVRTVIRNRFYDYFDSGFEDFNVGAYVSNLANVHFLDVNGNDAQCHPSRGRIFYHRCNSGDFPKVCSDT